MAKKVKEETEEKIGFYFLKEKPLDFISSGCTLLDLVLGGGFPLRRIANVIGDTSSNKTGLGIEVMANFNKKYPEGNIWYHELESAFDLDYACELGLPEKTELIEDVEEIPDVYQSILEKIEETNKLNVPSIYVIDSLDALLVPKKKEELSEGYDKARRAGVLNDMVTELAGKVKRANMLLFIVSQVRENIGVIFGEKYKRAGGKAMDFYASQCLWLSVLKKLKKTINKVERPYGIQTKAKCKKNKVGLPFRECEFPVIFGYGINNVLASLEWLADIGLLSELKIDKKSIKEETERILIEKDKEMETKIEDLVKLSWYEIEETFAVKVKKYS